MLFNSFEFLYLFLPIAWTGYFALQRWPSERPARLWLLGASLVFYSWWNVRYLPLYLCSICGNFLLSRAIRRAGQAPDPRARRLLVVGLVANVGLLAYFKYADFFIENIRWASGRDLPLLHLALPLAISFFTIQQIVYLVDTYEGVAADSPFLDYALFISFFPHLIAGPIVQHRELIPQFHDADRRGVRFENIWTGLLLISGGLLKKIVLADTFAIWVRQGFDQPTELGFFPAWAASLSYTLQLYFDFSGYSDIAIGIALLFNLQMPVNFRDPYRSRNMIQFWQTWHITLSRFITHYLYTPILRALPRVTFATSMVATLLAMLIAGAWHGADWKFVLFGLLHGVGLVATHVCKKRKVRLPVTLAWALTFLWVNFAFVFFRARTWSDAGRVLRGMFAPRALQFSTIQPWLLILIAFFILLRLPTLAEWVDAQKKGWGRGTLFVTVSAALAALLALEFQNANEFLYFKF